jgi:hypothetical protein
VTERWYAHPNDIIGGWSVLTVDRPPSTLSHAGDGWEVATFVSEADARRIVDLHNADLDGRLLPDGGRTRTEYEVRWHDDDGGGILMDERHFPSRAAAERRGPERIGEYGITRYSVHRRQHLIFEDGSSYSGPWVEAVDGGAGSVPTTASPQGVGHRSAQTAGTQPGHGSPPDRSRQSAERNATGEVS